jgi:hypothetical protein
MNLDELDNIAWPAPRAPSAEISASVRKICSSDLCPQKPIQNRRRIIGSVAISGALLTVLLTVGWMRHPPDRAIAWAILAAVVWSILQATVLCVSLAHPPGLRFARRIRWILGLSVLALFLGHLGFSATSHLSFDAFLTAPRSLHSTVVCGIHALLFGTLATGALIALWRRSDPVSPKLTGALTGLAGGLVGATALDLTCIRSEAWHLWLAHGATLVLLVVFGWFAGKRWLSP